MIYSSTRCEDRNASFLVVKRLRELLSSDALTNDATIGAPLGPALAHAFCRELEELPINKKIYKNGSYISTFQI